MSLPWNHEPTRPGSSARQEVAGVFDIYCPRCKSRRLIFAGQVRGITNASDGIHVAFECWCGGTGTWRTGSAA